jgi:hypothetical protein
VERDCSAIIAPAEVPAIAGSAAWCAASFFLDRPARARGVAHLRSRFGDGDASAGPGQGWRTRVYANHDFNRRVYESRYLIFNTLQQFLVSVAYGQH